MERKPVAVNPFQFHQHTGDFAGGGKRGINHVYNNIISVENLCQAWREFVRGKKSKRDVVEFSSRFSSNIFTLHHDLARKTYRHQGYKAFNISDPKPRNIHKAAVRDRLIHHAIYRVLYPFFDQLFIYDSYNCRNNKGTHRALDRFRYFIRRASKNNSHTCWVLKCDVRKFFASIDQSILMEILRRYLFDADVLWLLQQVIGSFYSTRAGKGLPLGNLTSQLLVNVYLNEFDQYVKHQLKEHYYIRYADDFIILSHDRARLEYLLSQIQEFLWERLWLTLHPNKVSIATVASGVDYLGWVHFSDHRVLRTVTRRRVLRGIQRSNGKREIVQSYLGLLEHGNAKKVRVQVETILNNRPF